MACYGKVLYLGRMHRAHVNIAHTLTAQTYSVMTVFIARHFIVILSAVLYGVLFYYSSFRKLLKRAVYG